MPPPGQGETAPEGRLFGDLRVIEVLMTFLATTDIGCFPGEAAGEVDRVLKDKLKGPRACGGGRKWGRGVAKGAT
jgi:hypothetical protein